jgi:hypothetical protein
LNRLIGRLTIVPAMPLDRSQVPPDAPEVKGYLLVIVEDADINKDNLIDFEERDLPGCPEKICHRSHRL